MVYRKLISYFILYQTLQAFSNLDRIEKGRLLGYPMEQHMEQEYKLYAWLPVHQQAGIVNASFVSQEHTNQALQVHASLATTAATLVHLIVFVQVVMKQPILDS